LFNQHRYTRSTNVNILDVDALQYQLGWNGMNSG